MVSYWIHIIKKDRNSYVHQAYIDGYINGTSKGVTFKENILCSQHVNNVLNHQSTAKKERLKFSIEYKLRMEYVHFCLKYKQQNNSKMLIYQHSVTIPYFIST